MPEPVTCQRCGTAKAGSVAEVLTDRYDSRALWCGECVDSYALCCDACSVYGVRSAGYRLNGDWYCYACGERRILCHSCGEILLRDDCEWRNDYAYCADCLPEDSDEDDGEDGGEPDSYGIRDYGYRPEPRFWGAAGQVHYGVELECSCRLKTAVKTVSLLGGVSHVYLKHDGTIVGGGYEIVTHPHTYPAMCELWKPWFAANPVNRGIQANENGLHVHIERKKLSPYRIGLIQAFLNCPSNHKLVTGIAGRDSVGWSKLKPELAKVQGHGDGDRYSALNLTNRATVEVRIFQGTVKAETFFARLGFVDALVRWSVDRSHKDLDCRSYAKFVRVNRKTYPELDRMLCGAGYLTPVPTQQKPLPLDAGVAPCAS